MRLRHLLPIVLIAVLFFGGLSACSTEPDAADQDFASEEIEDEADAEPAVEESEPEGEEAADESEADEPVVEEEVESIDDSESEEPAEESQDEVTDDTEEEGEDEVAGPPRGLASCKDPTDDVMNLDTGETAAGEPLAGTDLTNVTLSIDTDAVRVTWEAADPIASDAGPNAYGGSASVLWGVELWAGDTQIYTLDATLIGENWSAAAFDWVESYNYNASAPSVIGNQIRAVYPLSDLANLAGPLTWAALTEQDASDGYYHDLCPDSTELYPPVEDRMTLP